MSFVPTSSSIAHRRWLSITRFCLNQTKKFENEQQTPNDKPEFAEKSENPAEINSSDAEQQSLTHEEKQQLQRQRLLERKERKIFKEKLKEIFGKGAHGVAPNLFKSVNPASTSAANHYRHDPHKINANLAMQFYRLDEKHMRDLPVAGTQDGMKIYHLSDVLTKVKIVHGDDALTSPDFFGRLDRDRLGGTHNPSMKFPTMASDGELHNQHRMNDAQKSRISQFFSRILVDYQHENNQNEAEADSGAEQANKVVGFALAMNFADFLIKATAYFYTGSDSLFAETIHSFLDLCNQMILYYGNRVSIREPNPDFPYGFGNMKYISSLSSGFGILAFGCGLSVYNGVQGLMNPGVLESLSWGIGLLGISALLQSASWTRAILELQKRAANEGLALRKYLRSASADPSLKVVLFEDTASITGVLIALSCVSLTHFYSMPVFDSIGSIMIGGVLGAAAYKIIRANALHLVGRSLPKLKCKEIVEFMNADPIVRKMHDVKATYNGVNDYRFKAEIEYNGREITQLYLRENCDLDSLQRELAQIKCNAEFEEFMMRHGEHLIQKVGDEVDRLERKVRKKFPEIRHMDLESY